MVVSDLPIKRIIIVALFLVLDLWLGVRWLRMQRDEVLVPVKNFLLYVHPSLPEKILGSTLSKSVPEKIKPEVPFTAAEIVESITQERAERKLPPLESSEVLTSAAEQIVAAIITNNLSFENLDSSKLLTTYLQKKRVENLALYHDALIGPVTMVQLEKYWGTDADHLKTLASPDLTQIGVATGSATLNGEVQGIVVTIYAKPQAAVQQAAPITPPKTAQKIVFPEISNTSVLEALNAYRATHKVHQLVEHPKLCEYAEKRVQDLIAHGGLDGHEGFRKDFADPENLPAPIREYPGGAIGENLAYQNCRNMQTNEGFMAQNATALIEWCFDSSTKGHREAQLNPRYNNVCTRHQDGYFVIIFGE